MSQLLLGTSTAAHQIEGDNKNSDWWKYEKEMTEGISSGKACNSYKLYEEDIRLLKELGCNTYRFSIEWSRIEPNEGEFDLEALKHYGKIIDRLREEGIEPIVTLHHFTNPIWLSDKGGWTSDQAPTYFERYVEFVARHLGKEINYWITINEPNIYIILKYLIGVWFPYKRSPILCAKVYKNFIKGHEKAYRILKKHSPDSMVSLSIQFIRIEPIKNFFFPINLALSRIFEYFNHSMILRKHYKTNLDFIGINYYYKFPISLSLSTPRTFFIRTEKYLMERLKKKVEIHMIPSPEKLFQIVEELGKYNLPILITENGIDTTDDRNRVEFLKTIQKQIDKILQNNLPFLGYIYWTLMDNFEWSEAYNAKFGLYSCDEKNFKRVAKPSSKFFANLISKIERYK